MVEDGFPVPVILEQNHIVAAIIPFGNPENVNGFERAAPLQKPRQTFVCRGKNIWSDLLFQKSGIALAVLDAAGDAAEGGGGDVCLGHDLVVGLAL